MTLKRFSKFMSLVLRHHPELIGAQLQPGGWLPIKTLCEGAVKKGVPLTEDLLRTVVATNDKKRFEIDAQDLMVRASQGHSIPVDLGLVPRKPPARLYHGTATCFLESIQAKGLIAKSRNHVHLSLNHDTAIQVGKRHGKPVVLTILAKEMHTGGYRFYLSKNDVWLTEKVPLEYIDFNI